MGFYLLQLEEVQGLCDPNPTEYIDTDVAEPNIVFYWGLQPGRTNLLDIEAVEKDFLKNIHNGYQGCPGQMELSIVQASQLSKSAHFDPASEKRIKAYWKIPEYNLHRIPVYSQHLPHYFVGYVQANGDSKYPSAGG